jgi:hypothetical protein
MADLGIGRRQSIVYDLTQYPLLFFLVQPNQKPERPALLSRVCSSNHRSSNLELLFRF